MRSSIPRGTERHLRGPLRKGVPTHSRQRRHTNVKFPNGLLRELFRLITDFDESSHGPPAPSVLRGQPTLQSAELQVWMDLSCLGNHRHLAFPRFDPCKGAHVSALPHAALVTPFVTYFALVPCTLEELPSRQALQHASAGLSS
eukprot:4847522-Amphidinium_carterae.1